MVDMYRFRVCESTMVRTIQRHDRGHAAERKGVGHDDDGTYESTRERPCSPSMVSHGSGDAFE